MLAYLGLDVVFMSVMKSITYIHCGMIVFVYYITNTISYVYSSGAPAAGQDDVYARKRNIERDARGKRTDKTNLMKLPGL